MNGQGRTGNGGWSLMELVVVLAIIAILAAIITPMINSYVDRARINSARNDVRNIAAAIVSFNSDTRVWPIYTDKSEIPNGTAYARLVTDGDTAAVSSGLLDAAAWTAGSSGNLRAIVNENSLLLDTTGVRAWNGAYMNDISTDPWGTQYYFTSEHLKPGSANAAFILSAGPDKVIDTEYAQNHSGSFSVGGDDVVHRIR